MSHLCNMDSFNKLEVIIILKFLCQDPKTINLYPKNARITATKGPSVKLRAVEKWYEVITQTHISENIKEFISEMIQASLSKKTNPFWVPHYHPGYQLTNLGTKLSKKIQILIHPGYQLTNLGTTLPCWVPQITILGTKLCAVILYLCHNRVLRMRKFLSGTSIQNSTQICN